MFVVNTHLIQGSVLGSTAPLHREYFEYKATLFRIYALIEAQSLSISGG